jgi:hypothetical protein|tara:strand:+ start:1626 stop:1766 length:141 start_codon:yes stop_codon:yes gene_type:complete
MKAEFFINSDTLVKKITGEIVKAKDNKKMKTILYTLDQITGLVSKI